VISKTTLDRSPENLASLAAAAMFARDIAAQSLGIRIDEVRPGYARISMRIRQDMLYGHDMCHGGLIFTLADTAFAYACNSRNRATVAAGGAIEFLAPARANDVLIAEAEEQVLGGQLGVYDVVVRREQGERVALFRGRSYAIRGEVIRDDQDSAEARSRA
jgi:acyl-CoA thioesterase